MKSLKESININESTNDIESLIVNVVTLCNTQGGYQGIINEIMIALRNAADKKVKDTKKLAAKDPESYKYALQFHKAVESMDFDVHEILDNDKIWRE